LNAPSAPPFDRDTRDERVTELAGSQFDVLVIGGGITGAGIARDTAMRGLRTVLVERGDIASGTSSASSKLIHGGLRYLEQGEVGLVFESVSERHRLRQLAPHLVRPIPFLFPIHHKKPRPLWQVTVGLWIYDTLAMFRSYKLHRTFGARKTSALEPGMTTEGLDGSVLYYDCMTDDARLTLETARGAHDAGASVLTRCNVVGFRTHRSQICGADIVDLTTGKRHAIDARIVVNATGPWTDRTTGLRGNRPRLLRPTKGVHLLIAHDRLPVSHAVCLMSPEDKRVVFAIPWGSRVVLGTTDSDFDGDFDHVHCEVSDVDYLLEITNRYYPDAHLVRADILGTYAGLRPLVDPEQEGVGASQVSREHTISVDDDGLITVAGGKLTTYRRMAAEVVGVIAKRLKQEGFHVGGCPTGSVLLPGGAGITYRGSSLITLGPDGLEVERELEGCLGAQAVEHLKESYGGAWLGIAEEAAADRSLAARIVDDLPYLWAEVDHAVHHELAMTLRDVLRRRTQLEIRDLAAARQAAPAVASRMGRFLGWSEADTATQLEDWHRASAPSMAWRDDDPSG
jgi:glycerol-3-phosphate dehydrogenase